MKKYFVLFIAFISSIFANAQADLLESISGAMREGNSKDLASFFHSTIDLSMPDKENSYSRSQAEMVLKEFFNAHVPVSFTIDKKGSTDEFTKYAFGTYNCKEITFLVYIHLTKETDSFLIRKLRFEETKR